MRRSNPAAALLLAGALLQPLGMVAACSLGEREIGALTTTGAGDTSATGTTGSGSGSGSSSDSGTGTPVECTQDFAFQAEVSFVKDPGPDGVGTLYVRATAGECMLGPALAVWASPGIVDVRDFQQPNLPVTTDVMQIPCVNGSPSVVHVSAFLSEGSGADPADPAPRIGDMVNTVSGVDGVARPNDIAAGFTCVDLESSEPLVPYEIDEVWFETGSDTGTGP